MAETYDILIVGAGSAGLSAGIYGARAGKKVLIVEELSYGGQIINSPKVENYPGIGSISGFEYSMNMYKQAMDAGAEYKNGKVTGIDKVCGEDDAFEFIVTITAGKNEEKLTAGSIILATGVSHRKLGVPGENELKGMGVSYCATCDGAFFRGRNVAVVGGGSTALTDALFLAEYCKEVYLIHRRDSFRGEGRLVELVKARENISLILNSKIKSINGSEMVESVTIETKIENESSTDSYEVKETDIALTGVFVAVGQEPHNEAFSSLVELDKDGYIVADEDMKTSCDGIFAAGDARVKEVRQLVTAAADGAIAAIGAVEYLL